MKSKLCGSYHCRGCIVFTLSNFGEDVFQGFKVQKLWKANKGGMTTKGVSKLSELYHCRGCVVFTLCNFVVDTFQGFKVTKTIESKEEWYDHHRVFQTLRVIS